MSAKKKVVSTIENARGLRAEVCWKEKQRENSAEATLTEPNNQC
jgi:hypothetical protein